MQSAPAQGSGGDPTADGHPAWSAAIEGEGHALQSANTEREAQDTKLSGVHGALALIANEFQTHAQEHMAWELERSQLKSSVARLEGRCVGLENLNQQLMRRIKMLEYCLIQVRGQRTGEQLPAAADTPAQAVMATGEPGRGASPTSSRPQSTKKQSRPKYNSTTLPSNFQLRRPSSNNGVSKSRRILQDFLKDMGYMPSPGAERKERANSATLASPPLPGKANVSARRMSAPGVPGQGLPTPFVALQLEPGIPEAPEEEAKPLPAPERNGESKAAPRNTVEPESKPASALLTLIPEGSAPSRKLSVVGSLRAHLDTVRSINFHPRSPVLLSASEDGTIRMWNLEASKKLKKSGKLRKTLSIHPVRTCYSHAGPALCVSVGESGSVAASGGLDGIVRLMSLPSAQQLQKKASPTSSAERAQLGSQVLRGHTDAVWGVDVLEMPGSTPRIVSASADATVRVWTPGQGKEAAWNATVLTRPDSSVTPTCVRVQRKLSHSILHGKALVSYSSGDIVCWDLAQGEVCTKMQVPTRTGDAGTCSLSSFVVHDTAPLLLSAASDGRVHVFDARSGGAPVASSKAHSGEVSCIAGEPTGLVFASGGADGCIRIWDLRSVSLLETTAQVD